MFRASNDGGGGGGATTTFGDKINLILLMLSRKMHR
jgi:hypothetical protein